MDGHIIKPPYDKIKSDDGKIILLELESGELVFLKNGNPLDRRSVVMVYYYEHDAGIIRTTLISCSWITYVGKAKTIEEFNKNYPDGIFIKRVMMYEEEQPEKTDLIKAAKSIWECFSPYKWYVLGFVGFWVGMRYIIYLLYKIGWVWLASPLDFLMSWVGL